MNPVVTVVLVVFVLSVVVTFAIARMMRGPKQPSIQEQMDEVTYGKPMGCPTVLEYFTKMQDAERRHAEMTLDRMRSN